MRLRPAIGYLLTGVGLVLAIFGVNEFLAIDKCVDHGGAYDYVARRCSFDAQPLGTPDRYDVLALLVGAILTVAGLAILYARGTNEKRLDS